MEVFQYVLLILGAYLLGSIPTAVWVGKLFFNIDIRDYGSKNAGATNAIRVLGYKAGLPVFAIDVLKGFFAVKLISLSTLFVADTEKFILFQLLLGFSAVIGHIFPVFAGFKGGKGVATIAGTVLSIHPLATATAFGIFLVVVFISRYISLGSITAGISFPLIVHFLFGNSSSTLLIFSVVVSLLLIVTHTKNIKRLIKGEESKFRMKRKGNLSS